MLSSPKKKRKVFTHNSRPLNGILVPLTTKWSPKKKGLHSKFGDLKWKPGTIDGYVASPKITKRSSTIIRGLQMESGALRQLRGSLTTLLRDLYDGPLKYSFMDSYTPMGPGQIAPCNPQPPSFKPWMGYSIRAKNVTLAKSCQFRFASRSTMPSDCTQGIACDKFSPVRLWLRKIAAPLNEISLISKNRSAFLEFTLLAI